MNSCLLNIFPVELFHQLFSYFSAYEIFYTFKNISPFLDDVILTYSFLYVNFKSITRKEFDFVCQHIKPDQVISLTLSDDEHTPGQAGLFLSCLDISQFTHLRSLILIDIGPEFWEIIVSKLIHLKYLRSFIYNSSERYNFWLSKLSYNESGELDRRLFDSYSPVLVQLNRLQLSHGNFLTSVQFPQLEHLILKDCNAKIMQHISVAAPKLKSLKTVLRYDLLSTGFRFSFGQLNRLILEVQVSNVSMNSMESFITQLPNLKYLDLNICGDIDLVDGHRWQMVTGGLHTFNFTFILSFGAHVENLDSFCTPFWLVEKRWFVVYENECLRSIPHFVNKRMHDRFYLPALTTLNDPTVLYNHIAELIFSISLIDLNHRFTQVHTISISNSHHFSMIGRIVDLNRIQHLILSHMAGYQNLASFIKKMTNLNRISFILKITNCFEELSGELFEKIRHLEIEYSASLTLKNKGDIIRNQHIEQLCSIFPNLQRLEVRQPCSIDMILDFIYRLKKLSSASFYYATGLINPVASEPLIPKFEHAFNAYSSTYNHNLTYRFERTAVHLWL